MNGECADAFSRLFLHPELGESDAMQVYSNHVMSEYKFTYHALSQPVYLDSGNSLWAQSGEFVEERVL
ncbi:Hypothetical protein NTJ_07003 [Nesidiocoris tenuis]|uniref:Uncharacterized protein n=1 Tax=Nesidiocoris tenuis TaxID=355587 RepID=A0ABN7APQ0_9HEMI|nr:Hypothetical protein NTJ_07003 [Nesidiocoris tenuis]